jgi:hypothetical protein
MILTHPRHPGTPDQNTSAIEQYNLELDRRWTQHLSGDLPGVVSSDITRRQAGVDKSLSNCVGRSVFACDISLAPC